MLNIAELYYFSPTGGTKKVGEAFCDAIAEEVYKRDFVLQQEKASNLDSALTVIAVPVFSGRIPGVVADKIKEFNGAGRKAVTLVVYGNRAYEDALLELNDLVSEQGFKIIASGAYVAQHSLVASVAQGRPDKKDIDEIRNLAGKVLEKLDGNIIGEVSVPGNRPYKQATKTSVVPLTTETCTKCGECVKVCPTGAISKENVLIVTNLEKCVLCMACIARCPQKSRILPPTMEEQINKKLNSLKTVRKENEFFL